MKHFLIITFTLLFLGSTSAMAYDFGPGTIDLPEGFEKHETKQVRDQGMIHEFMNRHPGKESGTLLQITVYDFGQKLRPVPDGMLLAATENHLLDFTAGLRRHFETFDFIKMKSIKIDDASTAHIEWTGTTDNKTQRGTAFCLMKSSKVVIFHIQDAADAPLTNTIAALKAVNSVKMKE